MSVAREQIVIRGKLSPVWPIETQDPIRLFESTTRVKLSSALVKTLTEKGVTAKIPFLLIDEVPEGSYEVGVSISAAKSGVTAYEHTLKTLFYTIIWISADKKEPVINAIDEAFTLTSLEEDITVHVYAKSYNFDIPQPGRQGQFITSLVLMIPSNATSS